jgi:hypothetical protein
MHINYVEEFDKNLSEADKKKRKRFLIYRSNPGDPEDQPKFMSYYIELDGQRAQEQENRSGSPLSYTYLD